MDDEEKRQKNREKVRRWRENNPGKANEYVKNRYRKLRAAAVMAYGSRCSCCGESIERFLTIDHVEGGGKQHRDSMGSGNAAFYRWLEANQYPPGFQLLCSSCNVGKHVNAVCPHKSPLREPTSYIQRYRRGIKREVINAYGGQCSCCGQNELTFLTIDHKDDNGAEHRREKTGGRGGHQTYALLRREGYPDGYQVLCFNCNDGRHLNGGVCPHKTDEGE